MTKKQRETLAKSLKHLLSDWDCLCQGCIDLRAQWLSLLTGIAVQPLQMTQDDPEVALCFKEFAVEVDVDDFLAGKVRPERSLILFRSNTAAEPPVLYEVSSELADHLKAAVVQ